MLYFLRFQTQRIVPHRSGKTQRMFFPHTKNVLSWYENILSCRLRYEECCLLSYIIYISLLHFYYFSFFCVHSFHPLLYRFAFTFFFVSSYSSLYSYFFIFFIISYHIILIISHFNHFSDARQCEYVHVRVRATRTEDRSIDSSRTFNCFWFKGCVQQSIKRVNYNYWFAVRLPFSFLTSFYNWY